MKLSELVFLTNKLKTTHTDISLQNLQQGELKKLLQDMGFDISNLYQELEMDSPHVNAHEDTNRHADEVRLHSHSFYEILFCQSGNIQYCLGTQRYRIHKGDIVIIPPGISHQPLFPEQLAEPYHRYVLWISRSFIDELIRLSGMQLQAVPDTYLLRTAGTKWEMLENMFRQCCKEDFTKQPGYEAMLCGIATQLLVMLNRALLSIPPVLQEKPELIDEITCYLEQHLAEKITLPQMAKHFLVSESKISHLFQKKLGVSFYQWVIKRRLIAAKNLIQEGHTMENIFETVGFGDYTTFYRAFKKEYGISPSQYRDIV